MTHLIKVTDSLIYKTSSLERGTAKQKGRTCLNIYILFLTENQLGNELAYQDRVKIAIRNKKIVFTAKTFMQI